jgi:imidazolonepropionase-like amidohydrolase
MIQHRGGEMSETYASIADHLPTNVKRQLYAGDMKMPDDATAQRYKKSYQKMIEFVGRMYKAGIPLVAGTDAMPGFTLHSELEDYVKAGLTPAQALQVATWNGAKYSRTLSERGTITVGKLADLVLIDGDPTKNISDIRKVALVITQGKLLYPKEIDQALGIEPFFTDAPKLRAL